jgi:hypothetical protein
MSVQPLSCGICIDEINDLSYSVHRVKVKNDATVDHIFHTNCLIDWLKRTNNCPECRGEFTPEVISNPNISLINRWIRQIKSNSCAFYAKIPEIDIKLELKIHVLVIAVLGTYLSLQETRLNNHVHDVFMSLVMANISLASGLVAKLTHDFPYDAVSDLLGTITACA